MKFYFILVVLILIIVSESAPSPLKQSWIWKVKTATYGEVTHEMVQLNKSLADEPTKYFPCMAYKGPNTSEIYWRHWDFKRYLISGRKKRSIMKGIKPYPTTIPFLVSANYTECHLRRIAMAIRKFETLTCFRFVAFEGPGKHGDTVPLMINSLNTHDYDGCMGPFGQHGILDSTLDGVKYPYVGDLGLKPQCLRDTIEHEIMHILGFVHSEDDPYRQGPDDYFNRWRSPKEYLIPKEAVIETAPWDQLSAVGRLTSAWGFSVMHSLTDWDVHKVNKFYNCTRTTYGNVAIDQNKTPPPPVYNFNV